MDALDDIPAADNTGPEASGGGIDRSSRSRGRPPVPKERILATALKILDEEGAEALSLRALAQRLNSSTATLYRHFANRAELINQVVDHAFGTAPVAADDLHNLAWDDACRTMAKWMFENLSSHPNVAPLLVTRAPTGPNAMAQRELALRVLLDAGFSPPVALRGYATLARFVLGFAIQVDGDRASDDLVATQRHARAVDFPATATVADFVPVPLEEEFSFGLELLLTGLARWRSA